MYIFKSVCGFSALGDQHCGSGDANNNKQKKTQKLSKYKVKINNVCAY